MKQLDVNIFQRVFGRPVTKPPGNGDCWTLQNNVITIDLNLAVELRKDNGAVSIYNNDMTGKVIVVRTNGCFIAFRGRCRQKEKKANGEPGADECCVVHKNARDRDDAARTSIRDNCVVIYKVERHDHELRIYLN